jgi:hypothetical protein
VRDYLRGQGLDLPFADDASALGALAQTYRQSQERNYYAELGQRVAPHAGAIQEWLRARQAPVQQAVPAYKPPEFRREWLSQIEVDPATNLPRVKAGYDPAILEKAQAYQEWREKFFDAPEEILGPLVEERAGALVERRLAEHQEVVTANTLVNQNAGWLFQRDGQDRPMVGRFTPEGVVYAQAVQQLTAAGVRDVRQVHEWALIQVQNAVMRRHVGSMGGQQAPAAGLVAASAAGGAPSVGASLSRPGSGVETPPASQAGMSLRERLNRNLGALEPEGMFA